MKIIDTGANLQHFMYNMDRDLVMAKSAKFGVEKVIQLSTTVNKSI